MEERHENEQYFFDDNTVAKLCDLLERFEKPVVLCAPMLGREMARRGRPITFLDIDLRFADVPGFVEWSIYRPRPMRVRFDLILCDPPFFNVSLSQLFDALRQLSQFDFTQRLMVSYLVRRSSAIEGTFARFGLKRSGWCPGYRTVQRCDRNEIEFFANFEVTV